MPRYKQFIPTEIKKLESQPEDFQRRKKIFIVSGIVVLAVLMGLFTRISIQTYQKKSEAKTNAHLIQLMDAAKKSLEEGRYDEAIRDYSSVRDSKKGASFIKISASHNLAFVLFKKGNPQEALQVLERLIENPENKTPDYTKVLMANLYETQGETQKAKDLYKTLSEGSPLSSIREGAKERLAWLEKPQKAPKKKSKK